MPSSISIRTTSTPARRARRSGFTLSIILAAVATACAPSATTDPAPSSSSDPAVQLDEAPVVTGIPDNGEDPAVVALAIAGTELCSGTLLAPDVLLTARHCVSRTVSPITCPATAPQVSADLPPSSLIVLVGDDVATARPVATGKQLFTPPSDALCGEDIALVLLDQEVPGIAPLDVSTAAVTVGSHVTAIGYGRRGDGDAAGRKLLREHVAVLDVQPAELLVGEATCQGDSGGPALDETSGEIVGIVSRGGPTCDGADVHNVYTRTDAFAPLIAQALAASASHGTKPKVDAGTKASHSALGSPCKTADDCPSGLCVTGGGKQYCSRSCDTQDRCPAHYHCTATDKTDGGDAKACIQQP